MVKPQNVLEYWYSIPNDIKEYMGNLDIPIKYLGLCLKHNEPFDVSIFFKMQMACEMATRFNDYENIDGYTDEIVVCYKTLGEMCEECYGEQEIELRHREDIASEIAQYLVDEGTRNTYSGNYIFTFDEINDRFGVLLPDDKVMLNMIVDFLDYEIVLDCDITNSFDLIFGLDYCPNYEEEAE